MLVYVLGMDEDSLDPIHPTKARILLKQKKLLKNIYKIRVKYFAIHGVS